MTSWNFARDFIPLSELGSQPYIPPVTSDVVVDLSHWQAPVDFTQAKAAGITAVHREQIGWMCHLLRGLPPLPAPACWSELITFSMIRTRHCRSRTSCLWRETARCLHLIPSRIRSAARSRSHRLLKQRLGCTWRPAEHRSSIPAVTGPMSEAQVFQIASCLGARCGCPLITRGRFVHRVGRSGCCGNTPMGPSVQVRYRSRGSADVTGADSPAQ